MPISPQKQGVSQKVAVADPAYPDRVIKPNADGSINVSGATLSGNVGILDAADARINPATEETLDEIKTAAQSTTTVNVAQDSSVIYIGNTALTPKFAPIAVSSSGVNQIVGAVTAKKIRVLAFRVNGSAAVNWKFQKDTAGSPGDLTGLFYCASAGQGEIGAFAPTGLFETAAGENLGLNLSAAVAVGGYLVYIEV